MARPPLRRSRIAYTLAGIALFIIGFAFGAIVTHGHASSVSFVQGAAAENSGYSITLAYPAPVQAGDLLVAYERNYDDFGGTLVDTLNGPWKRAVVDCTSWDIIFYLPLTKAGMVTATLTSKQHGLNRLALMEYSGVAGNLVATASAKGPTHCGTNSQVANTNSTVPVPAGDLAVGGFTTTDNTAATASSGTVREHASGVDGTIYASDAVTTAGSAFQTLTWHGPHKWWAAIAVFS